MNIPVGDDDNSLSFQPARLQGRRLRGARAEMDCIVVFSACPGDGRADQRRRRCQTAGCPAWDEQFIFRFAGEVSRCRGRRVTWASGDDSKMTSPSPDTSPQIRWGGERKGTMFRCCQRLPTSPPWRGHAVRPGAARHHRHHQGQDRLDPGPSRADARRRRRQGARSRRQLVTPGLVDPHTHIVYGEEGLVDFEVLSQGRRPLVSRGAQGRRRRHDAAPAHWKRRCTRRARKRMSRLIANGVTTVESKSGCGMDKDTELRLMRTSRRLGAATCRSPSSRPISAPTGWRRSSPAGATTTSPFMCEEVLPGPSTGHRRSGRRFCE